MEAKPNQPCVGWYKPNGRGKRWKPVASGPTWGECWQALLDWMHRHSTGGQSTVLPEGQTPKSQL